ncbi:MULTISPECIES: DUF1376 domain-containing protein [unclassified Bartonella]|uniref:DUF1376 domain-containing protein n=1 Tax=unclassified Bartonella TaxID=2645622 RepID=UPI0035D0BD51
MSTKLAWVRCFPSDWVSDASGMTSHQISTYMMLILLMYKKRQPILENASILARISGCSVKAFNKALDFLLSDEKLIRLEDGRLWSLQVEEELNNSNENLNKFSERAQKAAKARWDKNTKDVCDIKHDANSMLKDAKHDACDAITNNTNIYNKKTKTIVLAKKEIGSESLETNEQVDEPTEVSAVETTSEQITTGVDNQPPIHEQENVPKKSKRAKTNRGYRLPEDFKPNLQYAIDQGLTHDEALLEFERFTNYWIANPGKNANKRDWQRTWYNWVTSPIGTLAKKKARLEQEERLGGYHGKFTQKTFTEQLAEGFNELRDHLSSAEDYGNDQSGVSIDAESWEYIDETGGSANLRCLQSSTSVALCESFS